MSEKEVIIKKSDLKPVSNGFLTLFVATCPICYGKFAHESQPRAIQALKLHIERKHKVKVVVQE
jgi:hypothetical protein